MAKAGIIEEMMQDAMESVMDSEDLEEETEEQVGRPAHPARTCLPAPCACLHAVAAQGAAQLDSRSWVAGVALPVGHLARSGIRCCCCPQLHSQPQLRSTTLSETATRLFAAGG